MSEAIRLWIEWKAKLHWCWYKREPYWAAETQREQIFVHHEIYHRVLKEELAKRGIKWKTRSE